MTKMPRVHIPGALYYVTSRGDHSEDIFVDEGDYRQYLELLKKYKEQHGFKLFAFALMPNHLHLLVELKEKLTISDVMHDLNSNYTKYFNGKYNKKGHLFQERYELVLVEKRAKLLIMSAYIHLNPKVLNLVPDIKDYPYSEYPYYLHYNTPQKIKTPLADLLSNDIKETLGYLETGDYKDYLGRVSTGERESLRKELTKNGIIGSEDFIAKIRSSIEEKKGAEDAKALRSEHVKRFILVGSITIVVLGALIIVLSAVNLRLNSKFRVISHDKDMEYSEKLTNEVKNVRKDLEELHKADQVSYQAMAKRLEIEKKRSRELENKTE